MEPDSLSAESAFPPPPPLVPPPVPPPVLLSSMSEEGANSLSLWRWNDRLAIVVGGLTLFLLGALAGRIVQPDVASDGDGSESIATVIASSQSAETATIPPEIGASAEEVNPPELIVDTEHGEPIATPESSTPATAVASTVESKTIASTPPPVEPIVTANVPTAVAPVPDSTPSADTSQTSPVSLEGKVLTIKPPAATQVCEPAQKYKDRKLSTALTWAESVQEAAERAEEEEKLVFLIHVSGNFEMPGFT